MRFARARIELHRLQRRRFYLGKRRLRPAPPIGEIEVRFSHAGICRSKTGVLACRSIKIFEGGFKISAGEPFPVKRTFQVSLVRSWINRTLCGKAGLLAGGHFDPNSSRDLLCDFSLQTEDVANISFIA